MPRKNKLSANERFKPLTEQELCMMQKVTLKENMLKADKKAEKAFVMYVSTLEDINSLKYRLFDEAKLDKLLSQFWYSLKTSDGDHYRVSSMKNGAGAELDITCTIIPFSKSLKKTLMKFVSCLKLLDTDM